MMLKIFFSKSDITKSPELSFNQLPCITSFVSLPVPLDTALSNIFLFQTRVLRSLADRMARLFWLSVVVAAMPCSRHRSLQATSARSKNPCSSVLSRLVATRHSSPTCASTSLLLRRCRHRVALVVDVVPLGAVPKPVLAITQHLAAATHLGAAVGEGVRRLVPGR